MPNKMRVAHPLVDEKQNAGGVGNPTGDQPEQRAGRQVRDQWPNNSYSRPAHRQIEKQTKSAMTQRTAGRFNDDSENREQPDGAENGRSPNTVKRAERERGVGSGDEKKNRAVIEHLESLFAAGLGPGVIKHRH